MKNVLFIFFATIGIVSLGIQYALGTDVLGLGFVAPTVDGRENVYGAVPGEIIYDKSDSSFYGCDHNSPCEWRKISTGGNLSVISINNTDSPYSSALNTSIIANAGTSAITINLPTAVGNTGAYTVIKKTDSSFNVVTIDAYNTETIEGNATTTLNTQNETVHLVSDGSGWKNLNRRTATNPSSYTPSTQGLGTISSVNVTWHRIGADIIITGYFTSGTVESSAVRIYLPSGLTISDDDFTDRFFVGNAIESAELNTLIAIGGNNFVTIGSGNGLWGDIIGTSFISSNTKFLFNFRVPIEGWKN